MRYLFFVLCLVVSLSACDRWKGDKGEIGSTGATGLTGENGTDGKNGADGKNGINGISTLLSTKIYTGTPNANPYSVSCPEIYPNWDAKSDSQIVQVYLMPGSNSKVLMPFTTYACTHYYFSGGTSILLSTIGTTGYSSPSVALSDYAWGQCSYRIEIRTFSTSSAAIAYKQSLNKSKDTINRLLGTD